MVEQQEIKIERDKKLLLWTKSFLSNLYLMAGFGNTHHITSQNDYEIFPVC